MSLGSESTVQKKQLKLLPCVREIVKVSKAEMYPACVGARTWADANQPRMSRILDFLLIICLKDIVRKRPNSSYLWDPID